MSADESSPLPPSFLDQIPPVAANAAALSEAERDAVHRLGDEFYIEYGRLVARFIDNAPSAQSADRLLEKVSELSNPYASCWDEHASKYRPMTPSEIICGRKPPSKSDEGGALPSAKPGRSSGPKR
jgi:hypothetical protein